jgi:hypothetical protein
VNYEEKYGHLRPILEAIAREYPEYGLPRIMTELRDVHRCHVNHKVVERLLGQWDLRILRGTRRRKPSGVYKAILEAGELANLVAPMAEIGLFEVVYTDFRAFVRRWRQKGLPDAHYRSRQQGSIRLGCR